MNTQFQRYMRLPTLDNGALTLVAPSPMAWVGQPGQGQLVNEPFWPSGMKGLVNISNRIGGLFINAESHFFYAGTAPEFSAFLASYAKLLDLERHRLRLHRGTGETGLEAGGQRWLCDWKISGHPGAFRAGLGAGGNVGSAAYDLEVHFWTGGRIALNEVVIPENVEVANDTAETN